MAAAELTSSSVGRTGVSSKKSSIVLLLFVGVTERRRNGKDFRPRRHPATDMNWDLEEYELEPSSFKHKGVCPL
jgi:hypothetical protein